MKKRDLGTELCLAVFRAEPEKVEQLLAEGADVNTIGDNRIPSVGGSTPLWLAANLAGQEISEAWGNLCDGLEEALPTMPRRDRIAKRERFLRVAKLLINGGSDLENLVHGSTPLRVAVCAKDLEFVKLLLSSGANPNAESFSVLSKLATKEGRKTLPGYYDTVLHEAVEKNSPLVVEALVAAGADPARANHEGKTPLDLAKQVKDQKMVSLLESAMSKPRRGIN